MIFSPEDQVLMQQGFIDGLEFRDLPLPEYTQKEVKIWRVGLHDGRAYAKNFWVAYHDIQKKENTAGELSILTQGFISVITNFPDPLYLLSNADRLTWNKGRRAAIRFQDVYRQRYNRWLVNDTLMEVLLTQMEKGFLPE